MNKLDKEIFQSDEKNKKLTDQLTKVKKDLVNQKSDLETAFNI